MLVHCLGDGHVCLRGRLYQSSVVDQMFRGQWAVEWAIRENIVGPERPLLIIGAGVTGMSAAVHALRYRHQQIPVYIVDCEKRPFRRQRGINSREIDPFGYHWPHPCHRDTCIDLAPLPIWKSSARALVLAWDRRWKEVFAHAGEQVTCVWSEAAQFPQFDETSRRWVMKLSENREIRAACVFDCRGFPAEATKFPSEQLTNNHVSYPFWRNDTLAQEDLGLKGDPPQVFIAGSGDGALQDLCRVATGCTGPELLRKLSDVLPKRFLSTINEMEIHAGRLLQLAGFHDDVRSQVLTSLHAEVCHEVDIRLKNASGRRLQEKITSLVRPVFLEPNTEAHIQLAYPHSYFTRCYTPNHVVALLLAAVVPTVKLAPGLTVHAVQSDCRMYSQYPSRHVGARSMAIVSRDGLPQESLGPFNLVINRTGFTRATPPEVQSIPVESHLLMPYSHPNWKLYAEVPVRMTYHAGKRT